ncbi:hypothetical protein Tco_1490745 [Tanacetum coccineum]
MPISTGMTAFMKQSVGGYIVLAPIFEGIVPELFSIIRDNFSWESESTDNVVPHKFFDLIASDGCNRFCFNPLCEVVNGYYQEFNFPRISFVRYSKIGVIHVSPSSSTTASTSISHIDFSFSSSTNTCLLKCAKLVDDILLSASAFLISLLGTCLIENALKLLASVRTFSRYRIMSTSFANPAPEPSVQDDPSTSRIHSSGSSSSASIRVSGDSYSGRSTMKSANICPLTDTLASLSVIKTALTVSFAAAK